MKEIKIIIDEITTKCVHDTFVEVVLDTIVDDTRSGVEYRHVHSGDVCMTHIITKADHIVIGSFYCSIDGNVHVTIHNCGSMNEVHLCVGYDSSGGTLIGHLTKFDNNHHGKRCIEYIVDMFDIMFKHDSVDEKSLYWCKIN